MTVRIPGSIPRAALVTGGAQRIGQAVALELAAAGFDVAIHFHGSASAAGETLARIEALGRRAVMLRADLAIEHEVDTLVPRATEALGPIGVLVNNASRFERDEWDDATREILGRAYRAEPAGALRADPGIRPRAPGRGRGSRDQHIDQRVWSLTPHFVSYTISKAGLWALTQTMALALAPRIRVNAIGPGPTLPSPRQTEEQFARQAGSVPLGHGSSPAEVAAAVLAILGLPAMTGQMIALDGGQHLQWSARQAAAEPEE